MGLMDLLISKPSEDFPSSCSILAANFLKQTVSFPHHLLFNVASNPGEMIPTFAHLLQDELSSYFSERMNSVEKSLAAG